MSKELTKNENKYSALKTIFVDNLESIKEIIPADVDMKRVIGGILMQAKINPALLECTDKSLVLGAITAAVLGLETNPAYHQFSLVPFNKKIKVGNDQWKQIKEAQAMVEYRGFITLAVRSGEVQQIDAYVVYQHEIDQGRFKLSYGLEPNIIHEPFLSSNDRGVLAGAYAVATSRDGNKKFHWMCREDIYKRRDSSKAYQSDMKYKKKDSPWLAWELEMFQKTVIKGIAKTLQLSPDKSSFNRAVAIDDKAQLGQNQHALIEELDGSDIDIPFEEGQPDENTTATFSETDLGRSSEGEEKKQPTQPKKAAGKTQPAKKETKEDKQLMAKAEAVAAFIKNNPLLRGTIFDAVGKKAKENKTSCLAMALIVPEKVNLWPNNHIETVFGMLPTLADMVKKPEPDLQTQTDQDEW